MRMIWVCLQIGWPQSQWIIISRFQWWDAQFSDAPCTLGFCRSTYLRNSNEKMPPMQNKDNSVRNLRPTEFMSIISQIWWASGMWIRTRPISNLWWHLFYIWGWIITTSQQRNGRWWLQYQGGCPIRFTSAELWEFRYMCDRISLCSPSHKADPNIPACAGLEIPIGRLWNRASY